MDGPIETGASSRVLKGITTPCVVDPFATTLTGARIIMKPRRMFSTTYITSLGIEPSFIGWILVGLGLGPDSSRRRRRFRTRFARRRNKSRLEGTGFAFNPRPLVDGAKRLVLSQESPSKAVKLKGDRTTVSPFHVHGVIDRTSERGTDILELLAGCLSHAAEVKLKHIGGNRTGRKGHHDRLKTRSGNGYIFTVKGPKVKAREKRHKSLDGLKGAKVNAIHDELVKRETATLYRRQAVIGLFDLLEKRRGCRFLKDRQKPLTAFRIHTTTVDIDEGLILVYLGSRNQIVSIEEVNILTGESNLAEIGVVRDHGHLADIMDVMSCEPVEQSAMGRLAVKGESTHVLG
jgi:hypothetical protein